MSKPVAWSYSALTSFETCARRHYLTRVSKEVREPETEVLRWGNAVHKALENRVKDGTPLPTGMDQWEGIVARVLAVDGEPFAEQQLALNSNLEPTEWFARDTWVRCIVDAGVKNGSKILALDWKTGKVKPDSDQLKLFAAAMMHHHPEVDEVVTGFVWLKFNKVTKDRFTRADLSEIWGEFIPRVRRLEIAHENDKWPANPSGLCRGWCPCTQCEFHQAK